jgi:hypothetical protein
VAAAASRVAALVSAMPVGGGGGGQGAEGRRTGAARERGRWPVRRRCSAGRRRAGARGTARQGGEGPAREALLGRAEA